MKSLAKNIGPESIPIGEKLKYLRMERDLSIREMSTICGVAVNTLSLIENGKSVPTINTLQNIANSLRIPITSFFEKSRNTGSVDSLKKLNRIIQTSPFGNFIALFSNEYRSTAIEPYVINIFPFTTWETDHITQPGYAFAFCLDGTVVFSISNNSYTLDAGDSVLFCLKEPHIWNNPTSSTSSFVFIFIQSEYQEKKISKYL